MKTPNQIKILPAELEIFAKCEAVIRQTDGIMAKFHPSQRGLAKRLLRDQIAATPEKAAELAAELALLDNKLEADRVYESIHRRRESARFETIRPLREILGRWKAALERHEEKFLADFAAATAQIAGSYKVTPRAPQIIQTRLDEINAKLTVLEANRLIEPATAYLEIVPGAAEQLAAAANHKFGGELSDSPPEEGV